jgi:hypothetical protein
VTLLVDFGATEFYERLQSRRGEMKNSGDAPVDAGKIAINAGLISVLHSRVFCSL